MLFAVPTRPMDLNVTGNEGDRLTITWTPPDVGTFYDSYSVYIYPGGPDGGVMKSKHSTTHTFLGLIANTEYSINITAVRSRGQFTLESRPKTIAGWTSKIYF